METIQNNLNRGKRIQPKGNIITESHGAILVARIDGGYFHKQTIKIIRL